MTTLNIDPVLFNITLYGQGFKVECRYQHALNMIIGFIHPYTIFRYERPEGSDWRTRKRWIAKDAFGVRLRFPEHQEFWFHMSKLKPLHDYLAEKLIGPEQVTISNGLTWEPAKATLNFTTKFTPYDYQLEGIEFINRLQPGTWQFGNYHIANDYRDRLIGLQTGKGKTVLGIADICRRGERVMMLMPPKYIEKWESDLQELTDIDIKRDYVVGQGESGIRRLIQSAKDDTLTAAVIMIPLRTMLMFINKFIENPVFAQEYFGISSPMELFKLCRPGSMLIDEAHEEFLSVYKALSFAAVPKCVKLSATFESTEPAAARVMGLVAPDHLRFEPEVGEQYIDMLAVDYRFSTVNPNQIVTTERGQTSYSQNAYEKYLMSNGRLMRNFEAMVLRWFEKAYVKNRLEGDKVRLYFGTIAMCTRISDLLRITYPQFSVKRYVEDDPYENIINPDVAVTTILSAGTAIDIKGLRATLSWIAIDSPRANKQLVGRLRELKDRDVRFYVFYCSQIAKHLKYHESRLINLRKRIKTVKMLYEPIGL